MRGMPPLSRRALLVGLAVTATGRRAHAQPKVFLDYDQDALDRAYDQRAWAPNMDAVLTRYVVNSDGVRARLGAPKTVAYGASAIETLDIYPTARANAPVLVFVHGGAWRTGKARDSAYAAETFVRAGANYVVPDFATVMEVGLDGMVAQVRRAVAWVAKNASSFGGHLAGTVLITDWSTDFGMPCDVVKGGVCISGMYDLRGPRLSARSRYVKFDDRIEHDYSAQRHLTRIQCPVIVAYGDQESPEFQRQSREFAEALRTAGRLHALIVGQGYNHFEIPETLASPYGLVGRAALDLMKLG